MCYGTVYTKNPFNTDHEESGVLVGESELYDRKALREHVNMLDKRL